jgi:Sulfotransferase family
MPDPRPRVLYVMGAGRSGSTILGVALGNCEDVFFAGELDKWAPRKGVPPLEGAERAEFWSQVLEQVGEQAQELGVEAKSLERSSGLLRLDRWPRRRRLRPRYRRLSEDLFQAVARTSGDGHVVDTSHYPLRARELQALEGIELHLLLLVRDPRSVVASFGREDVPERHFGVLTTNAYLWLTYLLSIAVFLRHPRRRRVVLRYEDFVAGPAAVLEDLLGRIGAPVQAPELGSLSTGLAFQGNRLLRTDSVALKIGAPSSPPDSALTSALQLPLRVLLGVLRPRVKPGPREAS